MSTRFYVERKPDIFEDIGADTVIFNAGGGLVFNDASGRMVLAYAAGQWQTVTQDDD